MHRTGNDVLKTRHDALLTYEEVLVAMVNDERDAQHQNEFMESSDDHFTEGHPFMTKL